MTGIIETIYNLLCDKPYSRREILDELVELFPDRDRKKMWTTINTQIPNRIEKKHNINIGRDWSRDHHRFFINNEDCHRYTETALNIFSRVEPIVLKNELYDIPTERFDVDLRIDRSSLTFDDELNIHVIVEVYDYKTHITNFFKVIVDFDDSILEVEHVDEKHNTMEFSPCNNIYGKYINETEYIDI